MGNGYEMKMQIRNIKGQLLLLLGHFWPTCSVNLNFQVKENDKKWTKDKHGNSLYVALYQFKTIL